jgi:hypothetical protein
MNVRTCWQRVEYQTEGRRVQTVPDCVNWQYLQRQTEPWRFGVAARLRRVRRSGLGRLICDLHPTRSLPPRLLLLDFSPPPAKTLSCALTPKECPTKTSRLPKLHPTRNQARQGFFDPSPNIRAVCCRVLVACKLCLIRPGVSLGIRLGVPPVSPRLSGNASARLVLLSPTSPTTRPQRPLNFTG